MRSTFQLLSVVVASTLATAACDETKPTAGTPGASPTTAKTAASGAVSTSAAKPAAAKIDAAKLGAFKPLPAKIENADNPSSPEKIALGKQLYFDPRLSKAQEESCNTCHGLDTYGVDGKKFSEGHKKQLGGRNAPTVYNAALQFAQFWDGRAKDVEQQATMPILNPKEMAMPDEKAVLAVVKSMPEYVDAFKKVFPDDKDAVSIANVGKAIGAFERTLLTPARWDKYLGGDQAALKETELAGLTLFLDSGCQSCHLGAGLGGTMFQKLGVVKPWPSTADQGRFEVTKQDADKMMFKVPLLRNITKTAPYFHDGGQPSLEGAVKQMAEFELGKQLSDADAKSIVGFLAVLTADSLPAGLVKAPELPKSTPKTPKPKDD
jgi:cytochrome c peroxidase